MEHRTLLLLVPLFLPCGSQGPPECAEQTVSANGMLELLPKKPPSEWARVQWKTGLDAGSYQVILVARRNKAASIRKSPFSGRAVFQEEPLSLRISAVHAADAGLYEAEFEDPDGGVSAPCFRVWVREPLQPPHVETVVLREARGWGNLSLRSRLLQRGCGAGAGAGVPAVPAGPWGCRPHRVLSTLL